MLCSPLGPCTDLEEYKHGEDPGLKLSCGSVGARLMVLCLGPILTDNQRFWLPALKTSRVIRVDIYDMGTKQKHSTRCAS